MDDIKKLDHMEVDELLRSLRSLSLSTYQNGEERERSDRLVNLTKLCVHLKSLYSRGIVNF